MTEQMREEMRPPVSQVTTDAEGVRVTSHPVPGSLQLDLSTAVESEPVGEAVQSSPRNLAGMQAHRHAPTGMFLPRFGARTLARLTWLCHVGKQAILGDPIHPVSGRRCQPMSALLSLGLQASLWSFTHM